MPSPQQNLKLAAERAFKTLGSQPKEQVRWLGADPVQPTWRLPVLDDVFHIDLPASRITTSTGEQVGPQWTILALHYLAVSARPEPRAPEMTFADLGAARTYAGVYHGRVIARLCATAGRDFQTLLNAAGAIGGNSVPAVADAAFDFDVFPRVSLRLIWHAPDDEFPPSATLLLPANIELYFCAEDIVVLSELLISRLGGRPF